MGDLLAKQRELLDAYHAASEMVPALERRIADLERSGFKKNRADYMKTLNDLREGTPEVPLFAD
jgi:hypothetical protein